MALSKCLSELTLLIISVVYSPSLEPQQLAHVNGVCTQCTVHEDTFYVYSPLLMLRCEHISENCLAKKSIVNSVVKYRAQFTHKSLSNQAVKSGEFAQPTKTQAKSADVLTGCCLKNLAEQQ